MSHRPGKAGRHHGHGNSKGCRSEERRYMGIMQDQGGLDEWQQTTRYIQERSFGANFGSSG
jgi:hypothetical protein